MEPLHRRYARSSPLRWKGYVELRERKGWEVSQATLSFLPAGNTNLKAEGLSSTDWIRQHRVLGLFHISSFCRFPRMGLLVPWLWPPSHGFSTDSAVGCILAPIIILGLCECLLEREASQIRCCPFLMCSTDVKRRQKIVISVTSVAFLLIISLAIIIWMGKGKNYIDSLLVQTIYLKSISAIALMLAVALAGYGGVLLSKMRNVRSERFSSEMLKVKSLAAISFLCFSTSSVLAIVTSYRLYIQATQLEGVLE